MAKSRKKSKKQGKGRTKKKVNLALRKEDLWPLLGALVITGITFARATGYDFVNWDDDFNISKNPNLRYFDWNNIRGIFTSHVIGNYNPLTTLSFAVEKHLFGLDASVFHTTNIILHLLCVFLVYRMVRLLDLPVWAAGFAALIFGIHPMRIESVAWITERKDVLFASFYLGAMIQYIKYVKTGDSRNKYLVFASALFVLSLLSKIQAVALPLSLLTLDYLMRPRLSWSLVWKKWYFFALSLAFGLLGVYFLRQQGSLESTSVYNFGSRIIVGIYSYIVYLVKFVQPFRISPLYPYPASLPWYAYASVAPFVGLLFLLYQGYRRNWKPLVFGFLFFTVNVAFVLQVVGAGQGFLADRFTYIPYLGLIFMVAYYGWQAVEKGGAKQKAGVLLFTALYSAAMFLQTWHYLPLWKNSETLWTHVLQYYQNTPLPYRNRAQFFRDSGQFDLALQDYNRSIELKRDPDVVNSRARLYFDRQMWPQALENYNLAIELSPETAEFYINRGAVYAMQSQWQPALRDMTEGLRLDPTFANGYKNRSLVYQNTGQTQEALEDLETYLRLNPYDSDIWYESARLQRILNRPQLALDALTRAIGLNGSNGIYWLERARVHVSIGNNAQAQGDLARAEALGAEIDAATRNAIMN